MGYEHSNSAGKKYYLNSMVAKNGKSLYFFSKEPKKPCELPQGYIVSENPLTKLPILKKK